MKFATITVLALVMLQAANTQRVLMIQDNTDDCFNAYKSFTTDIQEVIADVKKADYTSAISVVMTKIAPEVQALQSGDMVCYTKIMGDLVGEKCAAEVVKFGEDVMKYQQSKNMADLIAAIGDFTQGMTDCQAHQVSFTSFMVKDNTDDCFNAYKSMTTDIQLVIAAINKGDFPTAMSVVMTKIVPEVQALQSGNMDCYTKIIGDLVGPKCAAEVVKFGEDIMKYQQSKSIADLMAAIGDFTQGMTDCQAHQVSFTSFMVKDNNDDCFNAYTAFRTDIQEVIADIRKQDFPTAMSVVMTKIVPEVQAVQKGEWGCYSKIMEDLVGHMGDLVGQKCTADIVKFGQDVMIFQQSQNIADLMAAIGDFTQGMTDCQAHQVSLNATVDCNAEIQAVVAEIPVVVGHLKSQNYIALIGDIGSVKGHIDTITASCVTSSAACTTIETSIGTNLNAIVNDVVTNSDKATVEKHGTALADDLFDWRSTCFAQTPQ